jgi:hypothetical protein
MGMRREGKLILILQNERGMYEKNLKQFARLFFASAVDELIYSIENCRKHRIHVISRVENQNVYIYLYDERLQAVKNALKMNDK